MARSNSKHKRVRHKIRVRSKKRAEKRKKIIKESKTQPKPPSN